VKDGEGTEIIDLGTKQRHSLIVLLEIINALRNLDPDAQQLIALLKGNNWCIITDEYIELVLQLALGIKKLLEGHRSIDWVFTSLRYSIIHSEGQ
jgi:hypothetical protein